VAVPASATVPFVRSRGTTSANAIPNSADSTKCTATPTAGLVEPAAIAASPWTIVAVIRSGISAGPPVESTNTW
jgi:hypothetical protein